MKLLAFVFAFFVAIRAKEQWQKHVDECICRFCRTVPSQEKEPCSMRCLFLNVPQPYRQEIGVKASRDYFNWFEGMFDDSYDPNDECDTEPEKEMTWDDEVEQCIYDKCRYKEGAKREKCVEDCNMWMPPFPMRQYGNFKDHEPPFPLRQTVGFPDHDIPFPQRQNDYHVDYDIPFPQRQNGVTSGLAGYSTVAVVGVSAGLICLVAAGATMYARRGKTEEELQIL